MQALTLAIWDTKRLVRHRAIAASLIAVPLVVALARIALPKHHVTLVSAWACPPACVMLTFGVLYVQRVADRASGLVDGIRSTPLSHSHLRGSRAIAGFMLFAIQMVIFLGILAIRF